MPFAGFGRSFAFSISTSSISSTVSSDIIAFGWDDSSEEDLDRFLGLSESSASSTVYVIVSVDTDEVCRVGEGERGASPAGLLSRWAGGRERLLPYGLDECAFGMEHLRSIPSEASLQ